jgi:hypothetical protein
MEAQHTVASALLQRHFGISHRISSAFGKEREKRRFLSSSRVAALPSMAEAEFRLFGSAYADSKAFFYIGPDQRVCLVLENVREIPPGGRRFKRTEAVGKKTRNAARTLFFSRDSLISEAGRPERLRLLAGALDDAGAHSYGRSWGRSAPSPKETPEFLHPGQAAGAMGPSLLHVPLLGLRSLSD